MIGVVYLVLVFYGVGSNAGAAVSTPQANMAQCLQNAKAYGNKGKVRGSFCIAGVK